MRYANLLCVLMAALSTTSRTYAQQAVNIKDSLALVDFYNACNGPNWYFNHWFLETPVATWHGVTVTGDRVTAVEFIDNLIVGPIPESFGNLTSLQSLSVRFCPALFRSCGIKSSAFSSPRWASSSCFAWAGVILPSWAYCAADSSPSGF